MRKNPFWDFEFDQLRHLNPNYIVNKSTNCNILVSVDMISNMKIDLESSRSTESMVTLHLPSWLDWRPWPRRNFRNMGFHFFIEFIHFLSYFDRCEILSVRSRKLCTQPREFILKISVEKLSHEVKNWFLKNF